MARVKRDLTRITINMPSHVLEHVDTWANANGLSRTVAIQILCVDALAEKGVFGNREKEND